MRTKDFYAKRAKVGIRNVVEYRILVRRLFLGMMIATKEISLLIES